MTNIQKSIDIFVWRKLVPGMNTEFFKSRIAVTGSLAYISIFPLARKFLRHYLSGSGETIAVDTKRVVLANPEVFLMLQNAVANTLDGKDQSGNLQVSQLHVTHPNYKYSIGSFTLSYQLKDAILATRLQSNYHYRKDVDRLTRHLHNRMVDLKTNHEASDFDIEGTEWSLPVKEFSAGKVGKSIRNRIDFNRLYL